MSRIIKIDKGLYEVDDDTREYWFLEANPNWRNLDDNENELNKFSINEYMRVYLSGEKERFLKEENP